MSASTDPDVTKQELDRLRAERDGLQSQLSTLQTRRRRGGALRRVSVVVLVILACVSLMGAVVGYWANSTLLDTDGWVDTVAPLAGDPAVNAALAPRITEGVFSAIPAQDLIADALPDDRAFLAAPLSSAIESFAGDQVEAFLATDAFAELWVASNRVAHSSALAVLRGDGDVVQSADGTVTLNLLPVINQVLAQLGDSVSGLLGRDVTLPTIDSGELPAQAVQRLNDALGIQLPEDVGQIPVYSSSELTTAQTALRIFDQSFAFLIIAAPLLVAAALWLSRNRRATLIQLSVGSVLLLVLVRRVVLRYEEVLVTLPPRPEGRAAAAAVADQLRSGLFSLSAAVIIVAAIIFLIALVTGPYEWAVSLRRAAAPLGRRIWDGGTAPTSGTTPGAVVWLTRHRQALQVSGVVLAVAVLLLVDLSWGWLLALVVVLAGWELALWRLGGQPPADTPLGTSAPDPLAQDTMPAVRPL